MRQQVRGKITLNDGSVFASFEFELPRSPSAGELNVLLGKVEKFRRLVQEPTLIPNQKAVSKKTA